jgi:hypothetical protein
VVPSLFHATDVTDPECPLRVDAHSPVCAFQILMVSSSLALPIFVPSLFHATELTLRL